MILFKFWENLYSAAFIAALVVVIGILFFGMNIREWAQFTFVFAVLATLFNIRLRDWL